MTGINWIAVDWGTSNLRIWAMHDDTVVAEAGSDKGMSGLAPNEFEAALLDLIAPYLGDAVMPVICCGMVCSFAHHSYFNLDGQNSLAGHGLSVNADHYLPVDRAGIPLGLAAVSGTRCDLSHPMPLIDNAVFDHNFCLPPRTEQSLLSAAKLHTSALEMTVFTNAPGLQVYTGDGIAPNGPVGLSGTSYGSRAGLALEPQIWPDAPNNSAFPSAELNPGEKYYQLSRFRFCAR